jgi:hypothetical protein
MKWLPKLIPDWRLAWRFASVQAAVLLALLSGLQAEVLPLISPLFAVDVWPWVSGSLALAVVVLRLVSQDSLAIEREQLAREDSQAPVDPHRRPADVSPAMGAALLFGIGLMLALLATALWLLFKDGAAL